MTITLELDDLLSYTDWQRQLWHDFLRDKGNDILKTVAGPHGDGRLNTVGEIIRHIFSAEKRYIDRLSQRELTDAAKFPAHNVEQLFAFGQQSRSDFRAFLSGFPESKLDIPEEHTIAGHKIMLTPRKILLHLTMHEIRHWAQIQTLLRLNGFTAGFHDLLFSPVFDEKKVSV
jgi:uncharacterized damage-inducible protein DinB